MECFKSEILIIRQTKPARGWISLDHQAGKYLIKDYSIAESRLDSIPTSVFERAMDRQLYISC